MKALTSYPFFLPSILDNEGMPGQQSHSLPVLGLHNMIDRMVATLCLSIAIMRLYCQNTQ